MKACHSQEKAAAWSSASSKCEAIAEVTRRIAGGLRNAQSSLALLRDSICQAKSQSLADVRKCQQICREGMLAFVGACKQREVDLLSVVRKLSERLGRVNSLVIEQKQFSEVRVDLEMSQKHNKQLKGLLDATKEAAEQGLDALKQELARTKDSLRHQTEANRSMQQEFQEYRSTIQTALDEMAKYIKQLEANQQEDNQLLAEDLKKRWLLHTHNIRLEVNAAIARTIDKHITKYTH